MKNNFIAKHMNTYNKNVVHQDKSKVIVDDCSVEEGLNEYFEELVQNKKENLNNED